MDPFFTTKEVGKGTGLGLSMVYGFATQSGGAVRIDSTVGRGTTVEIWLPKAPDVAQSETNAITQAPSVPVLASQSLRILLTDDHAGVRATTAALLADSGHEIVEAAAGPEALAYLSANPARFDVLITDYAMPGMSGAELIRKARLLRPSLPAIIVTGYVEVASLGARPDDVEILTKPFDSKQLVQRLQALCASSPR
jgi:CheY-like chemotaxis protein